VYIKALTREPPTMTSIGERSPSHDSLFGDSCSLFGGSNPDLNTEESARLTPTHPKASEHNAVPANLNAPSNEREKSPIPEAPAWVSSLAENPTYGLAWAKDRLSLHPTWTVQPTVVSIISTLKTTIGSHQEYGVRFLHEGAYNKLYEVSFGDEFFIMRVSLPVCPRSKTESEVATLEWVYQHTNLPVPRVKAYDSSRNNPLGFEWILMTKIEGKPLSECWRSMRTGARERLVKQIAAFTASTFQQPFHDGVGSIYKATSNSDDCTHVVGELVSMAFF
jgi:hypothetical protein